MMHFCVFGGASPVASERHLELAIQVGRKIASVGGALVFGGGAAGVMGAVATATLQDGGQVIGVLPKFLTTREPPHAGVSDIRVVEGMHERKAIMYDLSDVFLVLPGGFGTLDEALEILTWKQLALHGKPVVFLGEKGFWDGIRNTFFNMHSDGLLSTIDLSQCRFAYSLEEAWRSLVEHRT